MFSILEEWQHSWVGLKERGLIYMTPSRNIHWEMRIPAASHSACSGIWTNGRVFVVSPIDQRDMPRRIDRARDEHNGCKQHSMCASLHSYSWIYS